MPIRFIMKVIVIAVALSGCFHEHPMNNHRYDLPRDRGCFELLHPAGWKTGGVEGRRSLILDRPGPQLPPVRRPGEYALLEGNDPLKNYRLVVEGQSLEPLSVVGRDVCILFGYQDDTHFYYAHISNDSNGETHNVIMKVAGDARSPIQMEKLPEPRMSEGWHRISVAHSASGSIRVWVDDMEKPLMTAHDTDYPAGRVGFGTFDDRAAFSAFEVYTDKRE